MWEWSFEVGGKGEASDSCQGSESGGMDVCVWGVDKKSWQEQQGLH